MRIAFVFPPNRAIPSVAYGGLPLLAGCVQAAGHHARIVDANLEVFERLIHSDPMRGICQRIDAEWERFRDGAPDTRESFQRYQGLAHVTLVPNEMLIQAERAGRVLRDAQLFADPEQVTWAFDVLANALRTAYALNPLAAPLAPNGLSDMYEHLEADASTPVCDLVDTYVIDEVLRDDPDLVAVSIPFNEQLFEALSLLRQLRRRADVPVILGGAIVSNYAEQLSADGRIFAYADYLMCGEADEALPQFCSTLEAGGDLGKVPNLYRRVDGEARAPTTTSLPNLNALPVPDYSSVGLSRYFLPSPVVNYQSSRGCYYGKCTFCSPDIRANFRFRRPERVTEDLEAIQEQTGARHYMFWDPLTPPRLMKEVAAWNKGRGEQQIFWGAETKFEATLIKPAFTDLLYEGGARFMQFGFESGSQRVLDLMVKGNDLERVDAVLANLRRSRIAVSVQWFIGFPGETQAEARASYRYLDERRESVLLSSYMGEFSLSPNDEIFQSGGDLYDIDILQGEGGWYDFRYRSGNEHYDRTELHGAYLARGDAESISRMAFFIYLTTTPESAASVSGFHRNGRLPETWEELAEQAPRPSSCLVVRSFPHDVFARLAADDEKLAAALASPSTAALVAHTQMVHRLDEDDVELIRAADGTRSAGAIAGPCSVRRARLLSLVRLGVLVVREEPCTTVAPRRAALGRTA